MDTGVIADGFRRHGRIVDADDLETRILHAGMVIGSPVEFFRGEADGSVAINAGPPIVAPHVRGTIHASRLGTV
jgi:hypothetical protein